MRIHSPDFYEVIRNNLTFDKENQKWTTSYPFITSLTVLQNNYGQAVACMKSLEAKLIKQIRLTEFNEASKTLWIVVSSRNCLPKILKNGGPREFYFARLRIQIWSAPEHPAEVVHEF